MPDRRPSVPAPAVPETVTGRELDRDVRRELSSLTPESAIAVGKHLVMVARLLDDDPELALQHALTARRRASRISVVREAVGLASYRCGKYAEALAELRTARRMTGSEEHLPIMADCERGLGRPERALALAAGPEVRKLDTAGRAEMLIVAAGARRDLAQPEAAVALLAVPELERAKPAPWLARLRWAYAEALDAAGRHQEATSWRARAAQADVDGSAGVADQVEDVDEVFIDLDDGDLEAVDLGGVDLGGVDLGGVDLGGVDLDRDDVGRDDLDRNDLGQETEDVSPRIELAGEPPTSGEHP